MNNLLAANLPVIIDVVAIVFVLAFTIYGHSKGFVRQFVSAFGTILSLLFAIMLCSSVANFLQSQFGFVETVSKSVGGVVSKMIGADASQITLAQLMDEQGRQILEQKGMATWMINIVMVFVADGAEGVPMDTTVYEILCPTIAYYVVLVIAVIALFIIFKILFYVLGKYAKKLHEVKFIAVFDKTLGMILGLACGIIYFEIIIMIIGIIPIQAVQNVHATIEQTVIASFISKINLYNVILNAISSTKVIYFVKNLLS